MTQVPKMLASLLIGSELLFVLGVGFTVDTEARIRATVAAGETIVTAITSYTRQHGRPPERLEALVPRYLRSIPQPLYGLRSWAYSPRDAEATGDNRVRIDFELPSVTTRLQARMTFVLGVPVHADHPEWRFRRRDDGCWQLPETPRCW